MKYYTFILACTLIIASCQKPSRVGDIPELLIDNTAIAQSADISDIIDAITIVPLKESPDSYIGDITKLYVSHSKYVIWDRFNTRQILLFDQAGNFIKVIMKTGDAPGETLQINDCWINYKNELEVYDYALKKVYQFDSTFTLSKTIKCQEFYMLNNIMRLPGSDKYVGYAGYISNPAHKDNYYRAAFLDQNLRINKTGMHYDKKYSGIQWTSIINHFYPYKDSIRMFQTCDNYIYDINGSGIKKIFKLVYKQNPLPDDIFEEFVDKNLEALKNRLTPYPEIDRIKADLAKYARFSGVWLENDKYIYIPTEYNKRFFFSLINKQTKRAVVSADVLYENRKFAVIIPFLKFYDPERDIFIGFVFGDQIKGFIRNDSKFQKEIKFDPETFYIFNIKFKS